MLLTDYCENGFSCWLYNSKCYFSIKAYTACHGSSYSLCVNIKFLFSAYIMPLRSISLWQVNFFLPSNFVVDFYSMMTWCKAFYFSEIGETCVSFSNLFNFFYFWQIKPISVRYGLGISDHDSEGRLVTLEFENFYLLSCYVPNSGDGL